MQDPDHLLRATLQSIRDAVVTTDEKARVLTLNAAAETMTGWSQPEAHLKPIEEILNLREYGTDSPRQNPAYDAVSENQKVEDPSPCLLVGKDGRRVSIHLAATPLVNPQGKPDGCLLIFNDASEALRLAERMSYLAQHDPLTGLPNRILLVDRLEQGCKFADRNSERLAVMLIDLDNFHDINSTHGDLVGDELLKQVAYRLTDSLRESDTVSRLGGDEFVIVISAVKDPPNLESLASRLIAQVSKPYEISGQPITTSCSIGISLYPQDANDVGTLMRRADGAMHQAKRSGRNQYHYAKPDPQPAAPNPKTPDTWFA